MKACNHDFNSLRNVFRPVGENWIHLHLYCKVRGWVSFGKWKAFAAMTANNTSFFCIFLKAL